MMNNLSVKATFLLLLLSLLSTQCKVLDPMHPRHGLSVQRSGVFEQAAVSGPHPLATAVAISILKDGGNAIDAAVAMQLAMAVCYPRAGNLGGGGFMIYRQADGQVQALDYRERAPMAAHRDMYLDSSGTVVADRSKLGHQAVGVPGTVAGLQAMHERYGNLPWEQLVDPAINLAQRGYRLSQAEADRLNHYQPQITQYNETGPFLGTFRTGQRMRQEELAATLRRIKEYGAREFYEGKTAELIVDEMAQGGGLITKDDLASYQAVWRQPIISDYRQCKVYSMPPSSSGGLALAQMLTMLEPYDLSDYPRQSVAQVHLLAEVMRRAFADRAAYLGDSDHYPVPISQLQDADYLDDRMQDFDPQQATASDTLSAGSPLGIESYETTHISIVDQLGNAVSITTTLNGNYGSKVIVDGAGFFLNNEMDDFSVKPGVPNQFGLVGAEANAIAPGKRMLSSMTPTIVEKDEELYLVLGAPGGPTIITAVLQTILGVVDYGLALDKAIAAPRIHHQWLPDAIVHERAAIDPPTQKALEGMGHSTRAIDRMAVVKAVMVLPDGRLHAASDQRNPDDDVAGY